MAATPYRPISWTDSNLTQEKLQQMSNNDQWLFENSPRLRYNYLNGSIVRDNGLKIISGKTSYSAIARDWVDVFAYFGSFFSAACKPVVNATVEPNSGRTTVSLSGLDFGVEMDYRGFRAHVNQLAAVGHPSQPVNGGWLHWMAVGF